MWFVSTPEGNVYQADCHFTLALPTSLQVGLETPHTPARPLQWLSSCVPRALGSSGVLDPQPFPVGLFAFACLEAMCEISFAKQGLRL